MEHGGSLAIEFQFSKSAPHRQHFRYHRQSLEGSLWLRDLWDSVLARLEGFIIQDTALRGQVLNGV